MNDTDPKPKPDSEPQATDETSPTTATPRSPGLGRRDFLATMGAMVPLAAAACGNDTPITGDGDTTGDDDSAGDGDSGTETDTGDGTSGDGDGTSGDGDGDGDGTSGDGDGDGDGTSGDGDGDGDGDGVACAEDNGTELAFDPAAIAEDAATFPRVPISGEMKPASFMISAYIGDGADKVLRVWRDSTTAGNVVLVEERTVTPDSDGYIKEIVDELGCSQWYSFALFDAAFANRSLICRVKTALAPGALEPVTFVLASCNGGNPNPNSPPASPYTWPSMDMTETLDYDIFIHLGDEAYMDGTFAAGGTSQQYLDSWGLFHSGGYRQVFSKAGVYSTWDDHEVTDNGDVQPWTTDVGDQQKITNAIEAYYKVMAIDATTRQDPLWRSFQWGDTVEFIILDCRYERDQNVYMSQAQMDWFKDRLLNSPCKFKIILNSVPFATVFFGLNPDSWFGRAAQRNEVLDWVNANNIQGAFWITGDLHSCYAGTVNPNPSTQADNMVEVAVTSGNTGFFLGGGEFEWSSNSPHVPLITLDPIAETLYIVYYDTSGGVAFERTYNIT